jgi:hypothetical protein
MDSLSTQLYKQTEKPDNILDDSRQLGISNDIVRDKQWAVICHNCIAAHETCSLNFICFMAKTKKDAIQQFIRTFDESIVPLLCCAYGKDFPDIHPLMYRDIIYINEEDKIEMEAFCNEYYMEILDCLMHYPSEFRFKCVEIINGVAYQN